MVNTLKYDRRMAAQRQGSEAAKNAKLLRNARKALKRAPISPLEKITPEKELSLLQDYVKLLEKDISTFESLYNDKDGKRAAAIYIRGARRRALERIARIMVGITAGEQ